jgi:hypothetical protein
MALIFRSILEIDDAEFFESAPAIFEHWLRRKLRNDDIDAAGGTFVRDGIAYEFSSISDAEFDARAYRARLFEQREQEQVRLTFTAMGTKAETWAWIDVERWTESVYEPGWVAYSPVLLTRVLESFTGRRAGTALRSSHELCAERDVRQLAADLLDPARWVPIVVVSPTRTEREGDIGPCEERAKELQRRLAGVARVVTLGPGATGALSAAMLQRLGDGWDVHSGAVRTYLPGIGPADVSRRHRYVPFHRLQARSADTAAKLVTLPLHAASCLQPPPPVWQERIRHLPAFAGGSGDGVLVELLEEAERERDEALAAGRATRQRIAEAQETTSEVLVQLDTLTRRITYLEGELAKTDAPALRAQPHEEVFQADWCEDVARHAARVLPDVVIGDRVLDAAGALDVHADNASWARKAWRALQAMQAYAEAKRAGTAETWDFKRFCEHSGDARVIPVTWVSLHEAESTADNRRFRDLRTLPVDTAVDSAGALYMPAHIRIEKGGTPCPRIHFHDDTDGPTGKVHIGWFGDHLDSGAKS